MSTLNLIICCATHKTVGVEYLTEFYNYLPNKIRGLTSSIQTHAYTGNILLFKSSECTIITFSLDS